MITTMLDQAAEYITDDLLDTGIGATTACAIGYGICRTISQAASHTVPSLVMFSGFAYLGHRTGLFSGAKQLFDGITEEFFSDAGAKASLGR